MSGDGTQAIWLAFHRDLNIPLNAPELERYLETWSKEESRALVRFGYRVRLAERGVMGGRPPLALGAIQRILCSEKLAQEKVTAICEYLDSHNIIGIGDPVKPYVLLPIDEIRTVFDKMVDKTTAQQIPPEELDMQTELRHRYLAFGYVFRVAEELVFGVEEPYSETPKNGVVPEQQELWANFSGRQNTASVLHEKANVVAYLIQTNLDCALRLAEPIANQNPRVILGEQQAIQVRTETAAFLLRPVLEIASGCLRCEEFDTFSRALAQSVTRVMEFEGVEPSGFNELLLERLREYDNYHKWLPEKEEGSAGTLFWEFGKKVATILGVGKNAAFQIILANLIMKSLKNWQLHQLLCDVPFPSSSQDLC
jgi:hypothetical protein